MNKKPEEFELKYIIKESEPGMLERIVDTFKMNGFEVISITDKENNDEYYDTANLDLYNKGGSLRTRIATQNGKVKYKGTYKMPLGEEKVYASRTEIEEKLSLPTFADFKNIMFSAGIPIDFSQITPSPVLNSTTKRTNIVLSKNGVEVTLSLDNTRYTNYQLNNLSVNDLMIEVEATGEITDRMILNEIHAFLANNIVGLELNKQSKYERGINSTKNLATKMTVEENARKKELN